MLYMFLLYGNEEKPLETSEPSISERLDFAKAAQARGAHVLSESLGGASNATTVRVRDGQEPRDRWTIPRDEGSYGRLLHSRMQGPR